jgi:3-dehydroquinate dehydratase-1
MKTLLTVPLRSKRPQDIERELKVKRKGVDAYEIWIDALPKTLQTPELLEGFFKHWRKQTKCKLIAVCKNRMEQGTYAGSDKKKVDLLFAVAPFVDFIDVGLHTDREEIRRLKKGKKKAKLTISHHDFKKTPGAIELKNIVKNAMKQGADIIKIATLVMSLEDNRRLIELAMDLKQRRLRHIIIGMGEKGIINRILSQGLGNELQFVALESSTAPGQLSLAQALELKTLFSST